MMADKRTIEFYDGAADRYDSFVGDAGPDAHLRAFMDLLPARARVLDLAAARRVHRRICVTLGSGRTLSMRLTGWWPLPTKPTTSARAS